VNDDDGADLADLRHEFDRSFAEAPPEGLARAQGLLVVRVAARDLLALRREDIGSIQKGRRILP
jgi:hypothetical protein